MADPELSKIVHRSKISGERLVVVVVGYDGYGEEWEWLGGGVDEAVFDR